MSRLVLTTLVLTGLFVKAISCDKDSCRYIYYSEEHDLKWRDFQGEVDIASTSFSLATAVSKIDIIARKIYQGDTVKFLVLNRFDKRVSWVKEPYDTSSYLLKHEQLHFDISELYARKIRRRLTEIQSNCQSIESFDFKNEVNKILDECDLQDEKYDFETHHGVLKEEQARWNEEIKSELAELEAYSGDTVICLCE
jgi:FtsZ-binding cell division protein ZapB